MFPDFTGKLDKILKSVIIVVVRSRVASKLKFNKKGERMVRKPYLFGALFALMIFASGCVTIYQECCDKDSGQCMKKHAKTEKGPNPIKKADDWVKQNIW